MSMLDWAKREVDIACKRENPDRKEGEFDYGCACYESALEAFEVLCNQGHNGFSIKMTQAILNRLVDGQPLTPIEDTDDIWKERDKVCNDRKTYQCKRMDALFKEVYDDGRIEYIDVDYCKCIDINNLDVTYALGLVTKIIHEMFPITMPYMPGNLIKVFCEDFLTDRKNGNFDTMGVFYALKDNNGEQEKIDISRFFREPNEGEEHTYPGWVEISKEEYEERKARKL